MGILDVLRRRKELARAAIRDPKMLESIYSDNSVASRIVRRHVPSALSEAFRENDASAHDAFLALAQISPSHAARAVPAVLKAFERADPGDARAWRSLITAIHVDPDRVPPRAADIIYRKLSGLWYVPQSDNIRAAHEHAIDAALAELSYGTSFILERLADHAERLVRNGNVPDHAYSFVDRVYSILEDPSPYVRSEEREVQPPRVAVARAREKLENAFLHTRDERFQKIYLKHRGRFPDGR
ncbi:MAG: hypothetical protein GXN93_01590 [Candidatus Diapherotrites archaeon]|nr:hypothetical protein [Candidatus Diapherotrites archaeon]